MENWLELLIPVVIVLLYLFQRMKAPDEEADRPPEQESQAAEEARRVQDEIRRKIISRQQGKLEEGEGLEGMGPVRLERLDERYEPPPPPFSGPPGPIQTHSFPLGSGGGRDYQKELQEQLRRVEESDREKAKVVGRIGRGGRQRREVLVEETAAIKTPAADLKRLLRNRNEVKKAFVVKEILSAPVSLRPSANSCSEFS